MLPPRARAALRAAAWPLFVVAGALLLLAPGLGPERLLAWRDTLKEFGPLRPFIAEALREGRLPLWDPFDGLGTPLLAQLIHGILHPASVILALVAPAASIEALLVAYVLLAGLGAYAAARALGASPPAAAAAGVGYAGSGYLLSSLGNLPFLAGGATLPWVLAAARWTGLGARLSGAGLAVAMASLLVAGDVHAAVVGGLLSLALVLQAGGPGALPRAAAALGAGGLLAGVQLLPAWHLLGETARSLGLPAPMREQWALHPWRLPELVAPGWLAGRTGDAAPVLYQALDPEGQFTLPFSGSIFVGSALLAAAVAATRVRAARPLLVAAPLLLWLSLGHWLGAQQLLQPVPVWRDLRYAEKLVGPLSLVLSLLAALGLPRLLAAAPVRLAGGLAAVAALLAGLAALPGPAEAVLGGWLPAEAVLAARAQAAVGLLQLSIGLAALAGLLLLAGRRPAPALTAFAALVLAQALLAVPFGLHTTPAPAPPPPVTAGDAPPPGPRVHSPQRHGVPPGEPDGIDLIHAASAALANPGYNVLARVDNVDLYSGLVPRRLEWLRGSLKATPRAWRRFGVTHVVLPAGPLDPPGLEAVVGGRLTREDELVQVWEVPHRPWASFAPAVELARGPREALYAMIAMDRAGRGGVVIEAAAAPPTAPGRVLTVARGAEAVAVEAEAEGPALLVVADAVWPGWTAEIDGAPVPILPADAMVRAVPFPAGRHRLVMRYEPPELRRGLALSGLGLLLLAALALLEVRARRPAAAPTRPPPDPSGAPP